MARVPLLLLVTTILLAAKSSAAEEARILSLDSRAAERLREAADLEQAGRLVDSVAAYQKLMDEAGDQLVPEDNVSRSFKSVRFIAQRRIASRPELLTLYRSRSESAALKALQALDSRNAVRLEKWVANSFLTRAAEAAILQLGDLACELGDFSAASRWWSLLDPGNPGFGFNYPDPKTPLSVIRARKLLALALSGDIARAKSELIIFQRRFPSDFGELAGEKGNLAEILTRLVSDPRLAAREVRMGAETGTTFAVNPKRDNGIPGILPEFAPESRYPPILLPGAGPRFDDRPIQRPIIRPESLAFHPVIVGGKIVVAGAQQIWVYDLATGMQTGRFSLPEVEANQSLEDLKLPLVNTARFTLSVAGKTVFARLGPSQPRGEPGFADSYIVSLHLEVDGSLKLRWILPSKKPGATVPSMFEGTPVICDGRLLVASTRIEANRAVCSVSCYDPTGVRPALLWQRDVFETGASSAVRSQRLLLTVAERSVVCGPFAGAIMALDTSSGQPIWANRYPVKDRIEETGPEPYRELTPCIFSDGLVLSSPAESASVLAFDARSGDLIWNCDRMEIGQMVGVLQGRLIGEVTGKSRGLCAIDIATGAIDPSWGYLVTPGDPLAPFGRGLIANDRVVWPTRANGLRELKADGSVIYPPSSFLGVSGGNLAFGEGALVIASEDRLQVLLPISPAAEKPAERKPHREAKKESKVNTALKDRLEQEKIVQRNRELEAGRIPLSGIEDAIHLPSADSNSVFVVKDRTLTRRDFPEGEERWLAKLPFSPSWVDEFHDQVLVAGEHGIACLDVQNGKMKWQTSDFDATAPDSLPWRDRFPVEPDSAKWQGFQRIGKQIFAWRDCRVLYVWNAMTGELQMKCFSTDNSLRIGPQYLPELAAASHFSLVRSHRQVASLFDTRNGQVIRTFSIAERGPAPFASNDDFLGLSDNDRLIVWDGQGNVRLTFDWPGVLTASADSPQLRFCGDQLVVAVPRDLGTEVFCWESLKSEPKLRGSNFIPGDPIPVESMIATSSSTIVYAAEKIMAFGSGSPLWSIFVPFGGFWKLESTSMGHVVAWSALELSASPRKVLAVLLIDPKDGKIMSTWEFGNAGLNPLVRVQGEWLTVRSGSEVRRLRLPGKAEAR